MKQDIGRVLFSVFVLRTLHLVLRCSLSLVDVKMKKFDTVKFQRKVREELSKKYTSNREGFLRELREKYGHLRKQRIGTHIR